MRKQTRKDINNIIIDHVVARYSKEQQPNEEFEKMDDAEKEALGIAIIEQMVAEFNKDNPEKERFENDKHDPATGRFAPKNGATGSKSSKEQGKIVSDTVKEDGKTYDLMKGEHPSQKKAAEELKKNSPSVLKRGYNVVSKGYTALSDRLGHVGATSVISAGLAAIAGGAVAGVGGSIASSVPFLALAGYLGIKKYQADKAEHERHRKLVQDKLNDAKKLADKILKTKASIEKSEEIGKLAEEIATRINKGQEDLKVEKHVEEKAIAESKKKSKEKKITRPVLENAPETPEDIKQLRRALEGTDIRERAKRELDKITAKADARRQALADGIIKEKPTKTPKTPEEQAGDTFRKQKESDRLKGKGGNPPSGGTGGTNPTSTPTPKPPFGPGSVTVSPPHSPIAPGFPGGPQVAPGSVKQKSLTQTAIDLKNKHLSEMFPGGQAMSEQQKKDDPLGWYLQLVEHENESGFQKAVEKLTGRPFSGENDIKEAALKDIENVKQGKGSILNPHTFPKGTVNAGLDKGPGVKTEPGMTSTLTKKIGSDDAGKPITEVVRGPSPITPTHSIDPNTLKKSETVAAPGIQEGATPNDQPRDTVYDRIRTGPNGEKIVQKDVQGRVNRTAASTTQKDRNDPDFEAARAKKEKDIQAALDYFKNTVGKNKPKPTNTPTTQPDLFTPPFGPNSNVTVSDPYDVGMPYKPSGGTSLSDLTKPTPPKQVDMPYSPSGGTSLSDLTKPTLVDDVKKAMQDAYKEREKARKKAFADNKKELKKKVEDGSATLKEMNEHLSGRKKHKWSREQAIQKVISKYRFDCNGSASSFASPGSTNTSLPQLIGKKKKTRFDNEEDFILWENIPIFKEHSKDDGFEMDMDAPTLEKIVDKCNERIDNTEDYPVIIDGHTKTDDDETRDVLGYASNFRIGEHGNKNKVKAIYVDFHIKKDKLDRAKELPRRSIELWKDAVADPIVLDKLPIDRISLLGDVRPALDLGLTMYSKENVSKKYKCSFQDCKVVPIKEAIMYFYEEWKKNKS